MSFLSSKRILQRCVSFVLVCTLVSSITPLAFGAETEGSSESSAMIDTRSSSSSSSTDATPGMANTFLNGAATPDGFQMENWTGAFTYNFPIKIPPGRNGIQPELSLHYSNQDKTINNILGYGWSLSLPSIRYYNQKGVDSLYTENSFISSLSGELIPTDLSDATHGEYRARTEEGDDLLYEYLADDSWFVTDKSGTTYTFGAGTGRQENDDGTLIYQWFLEEMMDANGNSIHYTYSASEGQIYPYQITYTDTDTSSGIFLVTFDYEIRDDTWPQYNTGFSISSTQRMSMIEVQMNGTWIHRYDLDYTTGSNGTRSLLQSVTETTRSDSGVETSLPPTSFEYTEADLGWTAVTGSELPVSLYDYHSDEKFARKFGDANGDGLTDIIVAYYYGPTHEYSYETKEVYLNKGNGEWELDTEYEIPIHFVETFGSGLQTDGGLLGDANGDGFVDIISTEDGVEIVYLNNQDKTWTSHTDWDIPISLVDSGSARSDILLVDINGDGFTDILQSYHSSTWTAGVYLNNTDDTGWTLSTDYHLPHVFFDSSSASSSNYFNGYELGDFNGDGLIDFLSSYYLDPGTRSVPCPWDATTYCDLYGHDNNIYYNQGDGTWEKDDHIDDFSNYFFANGDNGAGKGLKVADANGDGFSDILDAYHESFYASPINVIYINQGDNTWQEEEGEIPVYFSTGTNVQEDRAKMIFDFNYDLGSDMIYSYESSIGLASYYYRSDVTIPPDLLNVIEFSTGGTMEASYLASGNYYDASGERLNPDLPFDLVLLKQVNTTDGLGNESITSYSYEGGELYRNTTDIYDKQFSAFSTITKTESNRITKTYYEQDEFALIGKAKKVEVYDEDNNLYSRTIDTWSTTDLGDGSTFAYKTQSVTMDYEGTASHRDKAIAYTYDSNGNVKTIVHYGEVNADEDGTFTDDTTLDEKFTVTYTYATDSAGLIKDKVAEEKVTNSSGAIISRKRYYYDGSTTYGTVSTGNVTRAYDWLDSPSSTWIYTGYTYNSYGLVTAVRNPRGYTTSYAYDSYNLYPTTITNPKGYTVQMEYDYATGQVTSRTDENSLTTSTSYDGFGRPLTITVPDPSTGTATTLSTTSYDDESFPTSSTTITTVGGVTSEQVVYYDGFGRNIQSNTLAEDGTYNTVDFWYDENGNMREQSLPYETSSSVFGRDDSQYSVETTYDALNRPLTVTDPNGSTTYAYEPWQTTITDSNGNPKTFSYSANGQLLTVEEENEGSSYTTSYTYDPLGQLITLTDAQGHERNFDYDSLGRKLSEEDLHDPSEGDFGTWTYTYDYHGNLKTRTDPKGQVITWAYDQLDRVSYEDWDTTTTTRDVLYAYDTGTRGKMKLYKITSNSGDQAILWNTYDYLGNPTKEYYYFKKPGLTTYYSYLFQTTYDLLSRPTKITYPSSVLTVNYTYNAGGQLEKVTRGTTSLTNVVSDFDYSPSGQVESTTYGNGTVTTNTFDPSQAYRLTHKTTTGTYNNGTSSVSGNVQDLTYHYDALGNITSMTDASILPTAKTISYTYDDLNRLLTASTSGLSAGDYTESYSYDEVGNLTSKSDVGTLLYEGTGSSGANPHAVTSVAGTAYTYDDNGNLTSNGTSSYTWDKQNRLTASGSKTFAYDFAGQRYKIVDSTTGTDVYSYYLGRYGELRNGSSTSAGSANYYIFAGSQRIATRESTGAYTFNHQDHLGGTAVTTDSSGTISQIYDYYPYGEELQNTQLGTTDAVHSFTDKELDDALGLYYFEARWYNPTIGRFVSGDPAQHVYDPEGETGITTLLSNPQALNFYAYSGNNPVNNVDVSGNLYFDAKLMWLAASYVFDYVGLDITSDFLRHSLVFSPWDLTYNSDSSVAKTIKGSSDYTQIMDFVTSGIKNGERTGSTNQIAINGTKDLLAAINLATVSYTSTLNEDGSYSVNITISDTYDFSFVELDHYSFGEDSNLPDWALNLGVDAAALSESAWVINDFGVEINLQETITLDE